MSDDITDKIRLQPEYVDVSRDPDVDPFANDAIGRRTQAERLTRLVERIEGPCVIALDAPYGAGKTTFLRMWAQTLRNEGFRVAEFNAWTSDFDGKPSNALAAQIRDAIDADGSDIGAKVKAALSRFIEYGQPIVISLASMNIGIDDGGVVSASVNAGNILKSLLDKRQKKDASIQDIRDTLVEYTTKKGRIVVLIDELDRCRPPYAIETLEVAKHIFNIDGVVFALGLHRQQLTASIKAVYGQDFDAQGYLERFFDLSASLPVVRGSENLTVNSFIDGTVLPAGRGHERYIKTKLGAQQLRSEIERLSGKQNLFRLGFAEELALSVRGMTLRLIDRFERNLKITLVELLNDSHIHGMNYGMNHGVFECICVGLALKLLDPEMYARFNQGAASDKEVFDRLIENQELKKPRILAGLLVCAHIDISARLRGSNIPSYDLRSDIHNKVRAHTENFRKRNEEVSEFPDVLKRLSPFCESSSPQFFSSVEWVLNHQSGSNNSLSYWEEAVSVIEMFGE